MTEVELLIPTINNKISNHEKNLLDILAVPKLNQDKSYPIIIIEIKTSKGLAKHHESKKGIHNVKHLQIRLGKEKSLPVVVINTDRTKAGKIVTKTYGLLNGVLLIGKELLKKMEENPQQLLELISDTENKLNTLKQNHEMTVHPVTGELILINELNKEAFNLLEIEDVEKISLNKYNDILNKYSNLMNIPLSTLRKIIDSYIYNLADKNIQSLSKLKSLHRFICEEKVFPLQFVLQKNDPDISSLIEEKETIQKFIPLRIKLIDKKYTRHKGIEFEKLIKEELDEKGLKSISNIVCSAGVNKFEVDKLILEETGIIPVSCKDHSGYNNYAYLIDVIRNNANEIEHITEILNSKNGLLYVKVPAEYVEKVKAGLATREYINIRIIIKQ